MSSSHIFLAKLSVFLILLSQIINTILPERNAVSPIIWFAWILICVYYAVMNLFSDFGKKNSRFVVFLFVFWLINAVSFLYSPKRIIFDNGEIFTLEIFKSTTIALFSFFPFYFFTKNNFISRKQLLFFLTILFVFYGIDFVTSRAEIMEEASQEEGTFNASYNFALIMPLVFLLHKNNKSLIYISISLLVVLIGAKRGAILCFGVEMLIYLTYLLREDAFGKKHRFKIFFLLAVASVFVIYYLTSHDYLSQRILQVSTEDDTSGQIRTLRYGLLWNQFFLSEGKELFFGYGFSQTANIGGGLAHQDWIEILIDNGIIGGVVYLLLLFYCFRDIVKSHFSVPIVKYAYVCCLAIWIIRGSFSMVYTSRRCFILFIIIGIIQGMIRGHNEEKIVQK